MEGRVNISVVLNGHHNIPKEKQSSFNLSQKAY